MHSPEQRFRFRSIDTPAQRRARRKGGSPAMNRRITVAMAATATLGLAAAGVGTAGAAPKKNEIRILGGTTVKPGRFIKIDLRFGPRNLKVRSGSTVTLRKVSKEPEPHTISFIKKSFLPKQFETAAMGPLLAAHQVDP